MFKNAKVGDRVFDYFRQEWGIIVNIHNNFIHPISIKFPNCVFDSYTIEGKVNKNDKVPLLFWDEVEPIIPPKKPLPELEVDTKVIVWDNYDNSKYKRHFKEFSTNGKILCFIDGYTSWSNTSDSTGVPWDNWELADD